MSSNKSQKRVSQVLNQLQASEERKTVIPRPMSNATAAQSFKYTLDSKVLTLEQRQFYEENGYLLFKKLIPQKDLDLYRDHFRKLCNGEAERAVTMTVMRDVILKKKKDVTGEQMITKIQDFQDDPVLFSYCQSPQVLDIVEAIAGPNIKSIHSMLIHKPPNVGDSGRHPFHQDLYYFPMRPAERIAGIWTAMERVDRENGCLSVIPGSHKGELLAHGYPEWNGMVNKAYHGILNYKPPENRVHVIMEPGDTLIFHPLLHHASGANRTQGYRKAISCHYASADCQWIDVKGTIQEEISKEVEQMANMKSGFEIPFIDVWRFKSRLVRGKETNLA